MKAGFIQTKQSSQSVGLLWLLGTEKGDAGVVLAHIKTPCLEKGENRKQLQQIQTLTWLDQTLSVQGKHFQCAFAMPSGVIM